MKRLVSFVIALVLSAFNLCFKIYSHDFETGGIYYSILNSTEVEVTYKGNNFNQFKNEYSGNVEIPEKIIYDGAEYTVTSIGNHAFRDCTGVFSVTLPESLKAIGKWAFGNCYNLNSVTVPFSVKSIGDNAFLGCEELHHVDVPNPQAIIGKGAFEFEGNAQSNYVRRNNANGISAKNERDGTIRPKYRTDYRNCLILAYSPVNSVYEDENIRLEIYDEQLWASNKTQKTIFIDLSQCFLINNGSSYPMWARQQDEKKASKHGISTSNDEFLTLAPKTSEEQNETFICLMSAKVLGEYGTTERENETFSKYEKRFLNLVDEMVNESQQSDPKQKNFFGTVSRHLTEDESISNIGASVAYAFSKSPDDWTTVSLSTWVCDVIFAPYYVEMPRELSKREKRGFGAKETAPAIIHIKADSPFEYDEDKSPMIVTDWTGNFNKGTFKLDSTRISKTKGTGKAIGFVFLSMLTGGSTTALAFNTLSEVTYKSRINFDGKDSDWGKMNFASNIIHTKQMVKY